MSAENIENNGCSQRDNAEHEGYAKAHRSFNSIWKERNSAQPELLEKILHKDNLNRVLFSTLNDAPFFTLNGAVLAYKSKDSSFYL
jgi:hypothetical protein